MAANKSNLVVFPDNLPIPQDMGWIDEDDETQATTAPPFFQDACAVHDDDDDDDFSEESRLQHGQDLSQSERKFRRLRYALASLKLRRQKPFIENRALACRQDESTESSPTHCSQHPNEATCGWETHSETANVVVESKAGNDRWDRPFRRMRHRKPSKPKFHRDLLVDLDIDCGNHLQDVSLNTFFQQGHLESAKKKRDDILSFGEINAETRGTIMSGLAVDFDDGCAQLAIQPHPFEHGTDDDVRVNEWIRDDESLGVAFSHPAAGTSAVSPESTGKPRPPLPQWLETTSDSDWNGLESRQDEESVEVILSNVSPVMIKIESTHWENVGRSFSPDIFDDAMSEFNQASPTVKATPLHIPKKSDASRQSPLRVISVLHGDFEAPYDESQEKSSFLVSSDYSPKQGDVRNSNILPVFVA
jgi:hypothetical protein